MAKLASISASKSEREWQAEDDVRTLTRASEIRKDKARFARAKAKAQEQLKALQAATAAMATK